MIWMMHWHEHVRNLWDKKRGAAEANCNAKLQAKRTHLDNLVISPATQPRRQKKKSKERNVWYASLWGPYSIPFTDLTAHQYIFKFPSSLSHISSSSLSHHNFIKNLFLSFLLLSLWKKIEVLTSWLFCFIVLHGSENRERRNRLQSSGNDYALRQQLRRHRKPCHE